MQHAAEAKETRHRAPNERRGEEREGGVVEGGEGKRIICSSSAIFHSGQGRGEEEGREEDITTIKPVSFFTIIAFPLLHLLNPESWR
jgi:hypothetical protein